MITRVVRMTFQHGTTDAVWQVIENKLTLIRNFPGCSHLEILQDIAEPNVMASYSIWESEAHLNAYRQSALFGEIWPNVKKLLAQPAQANTYVQKINLQ